MSFLTRKCADSVYKPLKSLTAATVTFFIIAMVLSFVCLMMQVIGMVCFPAIDGNSVVLSQPESVSSAGAEETFYRYAVEYESSGGKERFEKTVMRGSDIASRKVVVVDLRTGDVSHELG